FYPKKGEVDKALEALKVYEIGKPLVVEEIFPLSCSLEEVDAFMKDSRHYVDGWVSFYWGKTSDEYQQQGDIQGAIVGAWLRHFQKQGPQMTQPGQAAAP